MPRQLCFFEIKAKRLTHKCNAFGLSSDLRSCLLQHRSQRMVSGNIRIGLKNNEASPILPSSFIHFDSFLRASSISL